MTDTRDATKKTRPRPVTIVDVAQQAKLSVATVSRVMHDNPRVSVEAQQRVRTAIEALGYTPNGLARGLAMRNTHTVGVLVASLSDPFWAEVIRGVEDTAYAHHYSVLVASSYEDSERERSALALFEMKRVDGLVIGGSSGGPAALQRLAPRRLPMIFVNDEHVDLDAVAAGDDSDALAQDSTIHLIRNDDLQGARDAVGYLVAAGHRAIAYIGASGRASSLRRRQGYLSALQRAGLPVDHECIVETAEGANGGELAAFRLLTAAVRPTALFCYDDMVALGALRAVRALGLTAAADVSVIGFDDIPIAAYLEPALTTVRQPIYQMGQQAMQMLLGAMQGLAQESIITMAGELIVRASTGPVLAMSRC